MIGTPFVMELAGVVDVLDGIGGGTAIDTAKFLAWKTGCPLLQMPTITSVDAGFTDPIGVRIGGRVRYIGSIVPIRVVIDVDVIRSAPLRLNRSGIGDILSCHTGLWDWKAASDAGHGHCWRDDLASLGERCSTSSRSARAPMAPDDWPSFFVSRSSRSLCSRSPCSAGSSVGLLREP